MAEMSLWGRRSDGESRRGRVSILQSSLIRIKSGGSGERTESLRQLLSLLQGPAAVRSQAAWDLGQLGGHHVLLLLMETTEVDEERDLCAELTDICARVCSRFPMKATPLMEDDGMEDSLGCELLVTSSLNKTRTPLKILLRRRAAKGGASERCPERKISNMLWSGSVVLIRRQGGGEVLEGGGGALAVLELGAGLGAGGIGFALLAQELKVCSDIEITDCDAGAVEMIWSSLRLNELLHEEEEEEAGAEAVEMVAAPLTAEEEDGQGKEREEGAGAGQREVHTRVRCNAFVLDWDRIEDSRADGENSGCTTSLATR
eukprot:762747-Hanusia_phi.AAC.5